MNSSPAKQAEANQSPVDKNALYGSFEDGEQAAQRLYERAAHKALDIRDDEAMPVINATRHGLGWKELAVIGAVLLGLVALIERFVERQPQTPRPMPTSSAEYEVRFFDRQGNPIDVPRSSQRRDQVTP